LAVPHALCVYDSIPKVDFSTTAQLQTWGAPYKAAQAYSDTLVECCLRPAAEKRSRCKEARRIKIYKNHEWIRNGQYQRVSGRKTARLGESTADFTIRGQNGRMAVLSAWRTGNAGIGQSGSRGAEFRIH
jgi:hypothetical protein